MRPRLARGLVAGLLLAVIGVPIAAGLLGTALPAFGLLPVDGGATPGLAAWHDLIATPGIATSLRLTLTTGVLSTMLAVALALGFAASRSDAPQTRWAALGLAPLLATPHAATAIGLAFLLAPSGWIVRLVASVTHWSTPPGVTTVGDPLGLALILGLLVKEVPFLLLVTGAATDQVPVRSLLRSGRALGYPPRRAWLLLVLPRLLGQIRLPILIVLAFSLSVVDMALVLGPGNPPTLAVQALRWFDDPDVTLYPRAAAAAMALLGVVLGMMAAWRALEAVAMEAARRWAARGRRHGPIDFAVRLAGALVPLLLAVGGVALLLLVIWSLAWRWPFPAPLPTAWSLDLWLRQAHAVAWPLADTLMLGGGTMLAGAILCVAWLETGGAGTLLLTVPLLLPQIAFLFGFQVLLARLRLDGTLLAAGWAQLPFVFAYMLIALADPWTALDRRYARAAATLGASRLRILFAIRLPLLRRPLAVAGAIGFAVSVAQYLPTLFAGAGRVATLTTEAVTLAAGGDRRVVAVLATLQALLPVALYAAALAVPGRDRSAARSLR